MRFEARGFVLAAAAAVAIAFALLPGWAVAAATQLTFSCFPNPGTLQAQLCERWAKTVNSQLEGSVQVKLFPSQALIKAAETADALSTGRVDIAWLPATWFAKLVPFEGVYDIPFVFTSHEGFKNAIQNGLGDIARREWRARNVEIIGMGDLGMLMWAAKKPVRTPADLKGLKVRVWTQVGGDVVAAAGGAGASMPQPELYLGVKTGVVDVAWTAPDFFASQKFWEVTPHFTKIPWNVYPNYLALHKPLWDRLDAKTKAVFSDAARKIFSEDSFLQEIEAEAQAEKQFRAANGTVTTFSAAELAEWHRLLEPIKVKWLKQLGPIGAEVEAIAAKYR